MQCLALLSLLYYQEIRKMEEVTSVGAQRKEGIRITFKSYLSDAHWLNKWLMRIG